MRSWTRGLPLLAAGVLLAVAAPAQAQVAGTYSWEQALTVRRGGDGGTQDEGAKATVKITLEVRGDSVSGTYTLLPPPNAEGATAAPQAREIRGTVNGNKVTFSMTQAGRLNMNGNTQEVQMTTTFNATVDGDVITGTIDIYAPEMPVTVPSRPFTGKRVTS